MNRKSGSRRNLVGITTRELFKRIFPSASRFIFRKFYQMIFRKSDFETRFARTGRVFILTRSRVVSLDMRI